MLDGDSRITCPPSRRTRGEYSSSGSQMMTLSLVVRMMKVISRLQLMDLPLPGVPNTSPLGLLDCLRSRRIMLLLKALRP